MTAVQQLETIRQDIRKILKNGALVEIYDKYCYIAGGAVRDILGKKNPSDIDIYFSSPSSAKMFREIIEKNLTVKNRPFSDQNLAKLRWLSSTDNAITFDIKGVGTVQFITKAEYCGLPEDVIHRFDFTINMGYYNNKQLVHLYQHDVSDGELVVNETTKYPGKLPARMLKFIRRGYNISMTQLYRLMVIASQVPVEPKDYNGSY